jgi:hypothetical protein
MDAIEALKAALTASHAKQVTVDEFSETRLNSKGEPYTYTRKKTRQQVNEVPADWRAAVEYLKRRDRSHWSERIDTTSVTIPITLELITLMQTLGLTPLDITEEMTALLEDIKARVGHD